MHSYNGQAQVKSNRVNSPRMAVMCAGFVALAAFSVFYQPVVVQGRSMLPALQDGQFLLMDRQHYRWNNVRKNDIVIFRHDRDLYVKRVYATAGKTVQVVKSSDGTASLIESLGPPVHVAKMIHNRPEIGQIVAVPVPAHCVFVVGDNENSSLDSRDFGPIRAKEILGYVPEPAPAKEHVVRTDLGSLRVAQR